MADNDDSKPSDCFENEIINEHSPRLDFFSDKFDPILALSAPSLKVPDVTAKTYDNLALYNAAIEEQTNPRKKKEKSEEISQIEIVRRWLPEQMPVRSTRKQKIKRNILSRMKEIKGPLAVLMKCVEQRLKIKIWTRNDRGIRGYIIGYVTAFDKHWNVAVEDVTEVWIRRKKRKIPALATIGNEFVSERRIRPPKIIVTPNEADAKLENCTRHVPQLMMRGEHIVCVIIQDQ